MITAKQRGGLGAMDKTAFRSLTYGMYLVSSLRDGKPVGCVANTFTQVTSNPAQASIALNKDNFTTQGVREAGAFEVAVLDQSASMELQAPIPISFRVLLPKRPHRVFRTFPNRYAHIFR